MKTLFHKPYWASNALVLSLLSLLLSLLCTGEALVKLPENVTVPAVILFGDSIVDQGANNNLRTLIKCNFAPYGQDFKGGVPTGRFSNGKTPPDLIAEELGIKELVPAYLDSNTKEEDLRTGVSFASGGSGYDPQTPKLVSVLSLADQLKMFNEYIGKLKGLVGEEETSNILANSLYLVVSGNNDLANTYYTIGLRRLQYDLPSYADLMAASASNFIQEIYKLGARRIGVFSAPPIGCLPAQRTLAGGALRVCVEDHNQGAHMYNMKLSSEIDSLDNSLSQAKIVYIDIYNSLLDIIKNPQSYGLDVVDRGCCGSGIVEVAILCNHATPTCLDNSKYLFWDSFHPTEKGYRLLVGQIIPKYVTSLSDQLDLYKEHVAKLNSSLGEDITSTVVSNNLYIVVARSNDITNTYFNNPLPRLHFDFSSYTDLMLDSASAFAQALYNLGARRIGVLVCHPKNFGKRSAKKLRRKLQSTSTAVQQEAVCTVELS
ncbi:hypothetical protein RJ639_015056 [Escallonia herrerae]|uniref:Uncharacterized protein n=1 Tax=Escallonia herrerae TaxID=1293975 RepID=A0AA89APF7_9ASTE|nr:hypothetical protein RJ639_015056 [Escallonia herrerae]